MASNGTQERVQINTSLLTAAGVIALFGSFLIGIAALIGANALISAVRDWTNQQEVPPGETAKSIIKQLHSAALVGTSAGADAWRSSISSSSDE
jgi:hypothetical protein